jgi:cell division protein FtsB
MRSPRTSPGRPNGLRAAGGWLHGQRRRAATVAAAVLTVAIGYHVVFGHNGLIAYGQKRQNARDLAAEVKDLQRENDDLRGHVDRLQTDPNAIEHQAREELHYTRPGEVIVTLPPDPAPVAAKPASKN